MVIVAYCYFEIQNTKSEVPAKVDRRSENDEIIINQTALDGREESTYYIITS